MDLHRSWSRAAVGRLYFDARPATAPRAVHEITAALANLTFQMKCPISIAACDRVDAIVLYHPRAARDELLAALSEHWTTLEALLDPAVPPLTCAVRPGVGWADDTADDRSYGESRCHLFATAIDSAAASWDAMDGDERCQLLADALRSAGNDPARPGCRPHDQRGRRRRRARTGRARHCHQHRGHRRAIA